MRKCCFNAGQMLIKESYPQVYGFKDASLGQTLGFDVLTEEFVQVLHTGRGHWVTISTIGCSIAEVDIFDSMPPAISSSLQNQIGKHPSAFHFNQLLLRNHLHNCLQQGCLLPFPVQ